MYLSFLFSFERSCGALAQLGERLPCKQEVAGSNPTISTKRIKRHPVSYTHLTLPTIA